MKYTQKGFVLPLVIILVTLAFIGGGYYFYSHKNVQTVGSQIEHKGPFVNRKEIGGQDMTIFAGAYGGTNISVDSDGNFKIDTSKLGVQYIAVQDKTYNPLAGFLYVPNYTTSILIDTRSTAIANIFLSPGIATTDPAEAKTRLQLIETSNCLPKLETFLSGKLEKQTLVEVSQDKTYQETLDQCQTEVFNKL